MNNIESLNRELEILESIYHNESRVKQRDLARIVGLSLGMTNSIIKRLIQKGWLKAKKINERNIHYIVSPQGIEEIAKRSYRYFRRTIKNVVYYKETIGKLVVHIKREGFKGIVLLGKSDLDFIVEHFCLKANLDFLRKEYADGQEGLFYLYSENHKPLLPDNKEVERANQAHLRDILIDLQAVSLGGA